MGPAPTRVGALRLLAATGVGMDWGWQKWGSLVSASYLKPEC